MYRLAPGNTKHVDEGKERCVKRIWESVGVTCSLSTKKRENTIIARKFAGELRQIGAQSRGSLRFGYFYL